MRVVGRWQMKTGHVVTLTQGGLVRAQDGQVLGQMWPLDQAKAELDKRGTRLK